MPSARSNASWPSRIAGRVRARRGRAALPTRARPRRSAPGGAASRSSRSTSGTISSTFWPAREPDRQVRLGGDRDHRLLQLRRTALDAVHVERRAPPTCGRRTRRPRSRPSAGRPGRRARRAPGCCKRPVGELLRRRRDHTLRAAAPAGGRRGPASTPESVRISACMAESAAPPNDARVQVALARPDLDVEVADPAGRDVERRLSTLRHVRVEDHAGVGAALVLRDPVDDRVAADLLLAVARDPHVDGQRALGGERRGRLQQEVELPLVVSDPACVEPLVADRRLEGRTLPEVERIGWLDVEMPVDHDRRRGVGVLRGANLAERERPLVDRRRGRTRRPHSGRSRRATPRRRGHRALRAGSALMLGMRSQLRDFLEPGRVDRHEREG